MSDEEILFEVIECMGNTQVGHIKLNAPRTLNSLTLSMVKKISALLDGWERDPDIKMILITGNGEKAFCAGGDIRALYESICSKEGPIYADNFFEAEYRLDYKIHQYSKPVITIVDGIVMGGGAGLMFASSYRIATERTRFSMPEMGIGLFPDVGFTFEIKNFPEGVALFIMLTAANLNASDTGFCNITNQIIHSDDLTKFFDSLTTTTWGDSSKENHGLLDSLLNKKEFKANLVDLKESKIEKELSTIQSLTNERDLVGVVDKILSYSTDDQWFLKGKGVIQNGCPTTAHLIWLQNEKSSQLDLKEVFKFELTMATNVARNGEFKEGVRALIIDKDNKPNWKHSSIASVASSWVDEHLVPIWNQHPLEDL